MPLDFNTSKIPLNKTTHSLRVSQLVYQYGPGSMVDFPDQTLMTAAPEYWAEQTERIHDERLEKALHVDYFGVPSSDKDAGHFDGVSYVRFPEWYFCPKCRSFKPISEWLKDYSRKATQDEKDKDQYMVKHMKCPQCRQPLVVSRIVTVCEHGHIDDFPWIDWVHARSFGNPKICARPSLEMKTAASTSEGLEGIEVICTSCKAKASLVGAFDKKVFEKLDEKFGDRYSFKCSGRHPWKHEQSTCHLYPRTMQRGSSSIYFPVTVASLVIPPYSSLLTTKIEQCTAFDEVRTSVNATKQTFSFVPTMSIDDKNNILKAQIQTGANRIAADIGADTDAVFKVLLRRWSLEEQETDNDISASDSSYRQEEYDALSGRIKISDEKYDGDFVREATVIDDYNLPFIKNISLIHKVREVIALTGFTRVNPLENSEDAPAKKNLVPIKEKDTKWYPAYQVRGEGIFIEFSEDEINRWRTSIPEAQGRAHQLNENYRKSFIGSRNPRTVTSKYLFLHTVSHLLIKQLSFECGYGIASLKERIYCSEMTDGKEMAGIFIYTAGGDSEGTLGGLVRQGRSDVFPNLFRKAIETAKICSNDPVCSLSKGQGRDSLNMAACYSCALIPETSCEDFNAFLDRGVVVGTMRDSRLGFFSKAIDTRWAEYQYLPGSTNSRTVQNNPPQTELPIKFVTPKVDSGLDTSGMDWKDIVGNLYAENETEQEIVNTLVAQCSSLTDKEQPIQDCEFDVAGEEEPYIAELLWPKSRVMIFATENNESYLAAKDSGWHCFMLTDESLSIDTLQTLLTDQGTR